jgi:hypothetical protein
VQFIPSDVRFNGVSKNLVTQSEPERLKVAEVSANMFPLLGTAPLIGRTLRASEDQPGVRHWPA